MERLEPPLDPPLYSYSTVLLVVSTVCCSQKGGSYEPNEPPPSAMGLTSTVLIFSAQSHADCTCALMKLIETGLVLFPPSFSSTRISAHTEINSTLGKNSRNYGTPSGTCSPNTNALLLGQN